MNTLLYILIPIVMIPVWSFLIKDIIKSHKEIFGGKREIYRLIEKCDKLYKNNKPYWVIEKRRFFGLYWTQFFGNHKYDGAVFQTWEDAMFWYNYYVDRNTRKSSKVLIQNN